MGKLTALGISKLKTPGKYADGGNLYLQVSSPGAKSWLFRYMLKGVAREMGLGSLASVSLQEARNKAREAKRKLQEDRVDPLEARANRRKGELLEAENLKTFEECARARFKQLLPEWKNKKHGDQWINTLTKYVFPIIGSMPVNEINPKIVLSVLNPIWTTKTETARRVMQRMRDVIDYAAMLGYRQDGKINPAVWDGVLDKLLPKPSKVSKVRHHPALPYSKIAGFMRKLREEQGAPARALELCVLTAARSGEIRGALTEEFDLEKAVWTIPAERMKAGEEHRIPLSVDAIALLKSVPMDPGAFVFTAIQRKPISATALADVIERMGYRDITVHGFRSTFKDWASESTTYANEVSEMALAHTIQNMAEAAYRRGDLLVKRKQLMADWGQYCRTGPQEEAPGN